MGMGAEVPPPHRLKEPEPGLSRMKSSSFPPARWRDPGRESGFLEGCCSPRLSLSPRSRDWSGSLATGLLTHHGRIVTKTQSQLPQTKSHPSTKKLQLDLPVEPSLPPPGSFVVNAGGIPLRMIRVEGDQFEMGSRHAGEGPTHRVRLRTFYLGETEVPWSVVEAYWAARPQDRPNNLQADLEKNLPAHSLRYQEWTRLLNWLSVQASPRREPYYDDAGGTSGGRQPPPIWQRPSASHRGGAGVRLAEAGRPGPQRFAPETDLRPESDVGIGVPRTLRGNVLGTRRGLVRRPSTRIRPLSTLDRPPWTERP